MALILVLALAGLSVFLMRHPTLKSFAFTSWVFTFVAASMARPSLFGTWLGVDLAVLITPLVQIIMFGMGTKLSLEDFRRVVVMPWPVFIGITLQYTVMPVAGFGIAKLFGFSPEVAAGIILIGSVSSGVASNLIVYLAGGSVALAVTLTAFSTIISPLMTPFLMQTLAGRMVPIDFVKMVLEILSMIVVPVVSGLVANRVLYGDRLWSNSGGPLSAIAAAGAVLAVALSFLPTELLGTFATLRNGAMVGVILIAVVALAKLIISVVAHRPNTWMDRVLPLVSMVGICLIIGIITARSRDKLLTVGGLLILAAILHNAIGYLCGYWLSRLARLDETTSRTVAIEVGMQNGGMASALAMSVLKSADAALAPAIFGPWMNISGSILASWWRKRPVNPAAVPPVGADNDRLPTISESTHPK